MRLRILLLQARDPDDPMGAHERRCFVRRTGLPDASFVPHDLCQGPPRVRDLARFDALMVGGSGDYYVSQGNLPDFEGYLEFLRELVARGHPTFASCFGYQSLVRALGGNVIHDPPNTEVGTFELTLTEAGREDPLFGALPPRFMAQMGHKDRAAQIADGVPNLARSLLSPFQALRIPGQPIWATQFHPELDRSTNTDRYLHYIEHYAPGTSEQERQALLSRFTDSDESSELLPRFLKLVFGD